MSKTTTYKQGKAEVVIESLVMDITGATPETLEKGVMAGATQIEAFARININQTFNGHGERGLQGSMFSVLVEASKDYAEAAIGPSKIYGRIHELGGIIKPVFAKMLSWIDPESGERIFARIVHMPARPYLRPAVDEHKPEILDVIGAEIAAQLDKRL